MQGTAPLLLGAAALGLIAIATVANAAPQRESVVLLHGLARDSGSMAKLAERLEAAGYSVTNLDYPSTDAEPRKLAGILRGEVERCCSAATRIHFVTYSMGGIILRAYLAEGPPDNLGRVVMIAPPNHGSEIVDLLGGLNLFRTILGPTAVTLGTGADGLAQTLPPPDYQVGVIAGDRPINPLGAAIIPGADDGTVSVESTKLAGMADFITVHRSHTFIAGAPEVGRQTMHFLRHGAFGVEPAAVGNDPDQPTR